MRTRSGREIPEPLLRHNEEQRRDPEEMVSDLGSRVQVVVLWRQHDDAAKQWLYLERMLPSAFSYERVKQRWGGGAYRIRLFGAWNRARRQEKYLTQVAFWIHHGFPPTAALRVRLRDVGRN